MNRNFTYSFLLFIFAQVSVRSYSQVSAAFSSDTTQGCAPLVIKFKDKSSGNPTSWRWDMGNGTVLFNSDPATTFLYPGTYTIKLVAGNGSSKDSVVKTDYIKVYPTPVTDFIASATTGCFPLPVKFTDLSTPQSGSLVKWEWDFGDGFSSPDHDPSPHTYNSIGNYHVSLRVTNSHGCEKTLSRLSYIKISTGALADFNLIAPDNCSPPTPVRFIDKSEGTGALTYKWDFGDGSTSPSQNPSHTYTTPGTFNVGLKITNDVGCVNQVIKPGIVTIGSVKADFISPAKVCAGQPFTISNNSSPSPSGADWDFGNGDRSADINPSYTYPKPGTYTIKLISNFGVCTDPASKTIEVLEKPTAGFTADKTSGCQSPMTVKFSSQSSEPVTYLWDFGDGKQSTDKDPAHTYDSEGEFDVTLVATNAIGCGETVFKSKFIVVKRALVFFDPLPEQGCAPLTISPIANILPPEQLATFHWIFGDGSISDDPHPQHTYTVQGTYTIKLLYTTVTGCNDSAFTTIIKVGNKPVLNFSANPKVTCAFIPVAFTDLSTGPVADQWKWEFGDGGTSEKKDPEHFYSDTGYFDVKLIAWSNGCSDTLVLKKFVQIKAPIARFIDSSSCGNVFRRWFLDRSIDAHEWFWDFGDGKTSIDPNPVHEYATTGNFIVKLTVKNDTCEHTTLKQVFIDGNKKDFSASATSVCTGVEITFIGSGFNDGDPSSIPSCHWDFGDGTSIESPVNATHQFNEPGTYTITLIVTNALGCSDTIIKPLYIKVQGPHAGFTTSSATVCANTPIVFIDTSSAEPGHPIVSWTWDYGDGQTQTLSSGPFSHSYKQPGNFTIQLTVADALGCRGTAVQNSSFTISKPSAGFESPDLVSCTKKPIRFLNRSTGNTNRYQWTFGDGQSSADPQPVIAYPAEGTYDIQLVATDAFDCTDTLVQKAYISIRDPRALFSVSDSIATCPPLVIQFTNRSENFISYEWNFGDKTRPAPNENPSHFYAFPGTYIAKLKISSSGGCMDSMSQKLVVSGPQGNFSYVAVNGCKPVTVSFKGTTTTNASFVWDYNDGSVEPGGPEITHSYDQLGSYLPRMILVDPQGCRVPVPGLDTIRVFGADAAFKQSTNILCDSGVVQFENLSVANEPIAGYKWDFGDGAGSTLQNPSFPFNVKGVFPVSLVVTTQSGCTDTVTSPVPVTVAEKPVIDFIGDTSVCMPTTLQFKGIIIRNDSSDLKWSWNFGNGATAQSQYPVSAIYRDQQEYKVSVVATSPIGCRDTVTQTVKPLPLPSVNAGEDKTIATGSSTQLLATSSPDVTGLTWTPQTGLSCIHCKDPVASPMKTTVYTVEGINSAGCKSRDDMTISVFCDAGNFFMPNTFSPNGDGVNDVFYPRGTGLFSVRTLRIFNRWGEVIFEQSDFNANDPSKGWKGFHNNKPSPQDVYVYSIDLICDNKVILNYKGNVALIR